MFPVGLDAVGYKADMAPPLAIPCARHDGPPPPSPNGPPRPAAVIIASTPAVVVGQGIPRTRAPSSFLTGLVTLEEQGKTCGCEPTWRKLQVTRRSGFAGAFGGVQERLQSFVWDRRPRLSAVETAGGDCPPRSGSWMAPLSHAIALRRISRNQDTSAIYVEWRRPGSNRQPPACKAALSQLSYVPEDGSIIRRGRLLANVVPGMRRHVRADVMIGGVWRSEASSGPAKQGAMEEEIGAIGGTAIAREPSVHSVHGGSARRACAVDSESASAYSAEGRLAIACTCLKSPPRRIASRNGVRGRGFCPPKPCETVDARSGTPSLFRTC